MADVNIEFTSWFTHHWTTTWAEANKKYIKAFSGSIFNRIEWREGRGFWVESGRGRVRENRWLNKAHQDKSVKQVTVMKGGSYHMRHHLPYIPTWILILFTSKMVYHYLNWDIQWTYFPLFLRPKLKNLYVMIVK